MNGTNVEQFDHNQVVRIIKDAGDTILLLVVDEYNDQSDIKRSYSQFGQSRRDMINKRNHTLGVFFKVEAKKPIINRIIEDNHRIAEAYGANSLDKLSFHAVKPRLVTVCRQNQKLGFTLRIDNKKHIIINIAKGFGYHLSPSLALNFTGCSMPPIE